MPRPRPRSGRSGRSCACSASAGSTATGRPLAAEVVDRYLAPDPRRLGGGIALPFAMALAEYDLAPQELALAVAAGNVDLGLEAELLAESDRRAVAMADATALARAAMDRMDANRTARRELLAVLGDPPRPWVGTGLGSAAIVDALDEARAAIDAGRRAGPGGRPAQPRARRSRPPGPPRPCSAGGHTRRRAAAWTRSTRRASRSRAAPSARSRSCAGSSTRRARAVAATSGS